MENKKTITLFTIVITVLAFLCTMIGIYSIYLRNEFDFITIYGETVKIYGGGIYGYHTTAQVYQVIPHDFVTLVLALPALVISLIYTRKGSLKARLFFAGVTLYFLFSYTIYSFYAMYNKLFICYIAIMGLSFYTLYLTLKGIDALKVKDLFSIGYPHKLVGGFLIFVSTLMTLFWLKPISATIFSGSIPAADLGQSTTLVVYAIDLGFILPLAFVMGIRLWRQKPEGYVAGTILPVFLIFIMTAVFSKGVMLYLTNTATVIEMMIMIGTFGLLALTAVFINFSSMKKEGLDEHTRKKTKRA